MRKFVHAIMVLFMGISFSCGDETEEPVSKPKTQPETKAPFYLRPVFLRFEEMATKEVVGNVLSNMKDMKIMSSDASYPPLGEINYMLRWQIFDKASGYDPNIYARLYAACLKCDYWAKRDKVAKQPELWNWRKGLLEVARNYLSDPGRLKKTYRIFQPKIQNFVNSHPQKAKIKKYIHDVLLPVFTGTIDPEFPKKVAKYLALRGLAEGQKARESAMERFCPGISCQVSPEYRFDPKEGSHCNDVAYQELKEATVASGKTFNHWYELYEKLRGDSRYPIYEYEWMLRRYGEGGDKLVRAWAWIFADIGKTIP